MTSLIIRPPQADAKASAFFITNRIKYKLKLFPPLVIPDNR